MQTWHWSSIQLNLCNFRWTTGPNLRKFKWNKWGALWHNSSKQTTHRTLRRNWRCKWVSLWFQWNLSEDVEIPPVLIESNDSLVLNEVKDQECRMVQLLNKGQREFFGHILHLIKTLDKYYMCCRSISY